MEPKFFENDISRNAANEVKKCRSAAAGSIEQSIVFYKNAAPLERKGRKAKQLLEFIFVLEPQRGEILVDLMYFVLEPQRGEILMAHFNQVLSI